MTRRFLLVPVSLGFMRKCLLGDILSDIWHIEEFPLAVPLGFSKTDSERQICILRSERNYITSLVVVSEPQFYRNINDPL